MYVTNILPTDVGPAVMNAATDLAPQLAQRLEVGLALRKARKAAGLETAQAAERGGISVSMLGSIERGTHSLTSVSAGALAKLPAAWGLDWKGFTRIVAPAYAPYIPVLAHSLAMPRGKSVDMSGVYRVPVVGIAAAGSGAEINEAEPLDYEYVAAANYRPQMVILQIDGDSMRKSGDIDSLDTGDWVYVDPYLLSLEENKIFIVYKPDMGVVIKRIRKWGDIWVLTSDNINYAPIFPDEDTRIIGRVYYRHPKGERL